MSDIKIIGPSIKPWKQYIERLEREPSASTKAGLKAVLDAAHVTAQINTHVLSGRMLASMYTRSDEKRTPRVNKWEGAISVGRGIPYTKYEFGTTNAKHGPRTDWTVHPSHDPYEGLEIYYAGVEAVLDALGR